MREAIRSHLASGRGESHGRKYTYTMLRKQGVSVARDRLGDILKEEKSIAGLSQSKFGEKNIPRGEYWVPGPNYIWSVDGHMKLELFGIEIYAGVDAYSRYITWIYVGVSARTAVSVLRGYLDTVESCGFLPLMIRSDRGSETPMMAEYHLFLWKTLYPEVTLRDIYRYGTSVKNQRIESWWNMMTKGQTGKWKLYFRRLQGRGLFTKDDLADEIALLFVFFPVIKDEVLEFVEMWNVHEIRKQRTRYISLH